MGTREEMESASEKPEKKQRKAVSLDYEETEQAPRVSAKGEGELARLIIELAEEHNVPLHRDPDLTEVLYKLDLDEQIPPSLYEAVAEVFAFLYRLNRREKVEE